jgi:hypothetical protein
LRPPKRFVEVIGGAVERDADAKELRFFVPLDDSSTELTMVPQKLAPSASSISAERQAQYAAADLDISTEGLQRVFVHPSSTNFNNVAFTSSNFLLYAEKQIQNNLGSQPKIYLRNTSEVSAFALLFLGGELQADYLSGVLTVDSWIRLASLFIVHV